MLEILKDNLFDSFDRVLLAVSGGADSVAMAHALCQLCQAGRLDCEFVIAHINHNLRGAASDADEAFVKELGKALGVDVVTQSVDVTRHAKTHKLSIETAGRILRQEALSSIAADHDCRAIATAHHADDQAETMIHRLMRGTGFRGLCGIKPMSTIDGTVYVRPMLNIRRAEIIDYCKDHNLQWRHDESNTDLQFTRNRIRHRLLPAVGGESENLVGAFLDLSKAARRFSDNAEQHAQEILDEAMIEQASPASIDLRIDLLRDCSPWVFYEIIRNVLVKLNVGLRDYTKQHFESIRALMDQTEAALSLPGQVQAYTQKGILGFCCGVQGADLPPVPVELEVEEAVQFGCWRILSRLFDVNQAEIKTFLKKKDAFVEWFDADTIAGPLIIRTRQDGDRFIPIGTKSEKKVGRFLQDGQFDADTRQNAFVIADAEKILWVAPVRMSELAKITDQTTAVLEIRVECLDK